MDKQKSIELNELFTALAKAQSDMEIAGLTNTNPFFKSKYADLAEVVKSSRPSLTKHGLSVVQQITTTEVGMELVTVLGHSSGQWISSVMPINPAKSDAQSIGSYITYLRRYSYAALVGVVVGDEDDDGEAAMDRNITQVKARPIQPEKKQVAPATKQEATIDQEVVTKEQYDDLMFELEGHPDIALDILTKMHLKSFKEFPRSKYQDGVRKIRDIKSKLPKKD